MANSKPLGPGEGGQHVVAVQANMDIISSTFPDVPVTEQSSGFFMDRPVAGGGYNIWFNVKDASGKYNLLQLQMSTLKVTDNGNAGGIEIEGKVEIMNAPAANWAVGNSVKFNISSAAVFIQNLTNGKSAMGLGAPVVARATWP